MQASDLTHCNRARDSSGSEDRDGDEEGRELHGGTLERLER